MISKEQLQAKLGTPPETFDAIWNDAVELAQVLNVRVPDILPSCL